LQLCCEEEEQVKTATTNMEWNGIEEEEGNFLLLALFYSFRIDYV
jgi:hypothetical protein